MTNDRFVYVSYIRTTPEKLWDALQKPEFTRLYWFGATLESEWRKGASWKIVLPDGRVADAGEIADIEKPKRMVIKWRNEFRPDLKAEGYSLCTIELEPTPDSVKLTVVHEIDKPGSKLIQAVSGGWPKILSSLKSMLETGEALGGPKPVHA
ncbi:MAG: SRPBCC family protein [Proteobacteria bacterium]|nr:SRPBCC family protein [Pseudomonadota bacterium]